MQITRRTFASSSPPVKTGAENRHKRHRIPGELCFKGHGRHGFNDEKFRIHPTAEKANKGHAEAQKAVFVENQQLLNAVVEKHPQESAQTGLSAVEAGTDVGNHFVASRLTQAISLPQQVRLLVVRGNSGLTDNLSPGRFR